MALKKYINTADVVELTGLTTNEVLNLAKTGALPTHKTRRGHYRYNVDAVEKYFGIQVNKAAEEVEDKPIKEEKTIFPSDTRLITENHYKEVIERICAAKNSIRIMTGDFKLFKLKPTAKQGKSYNDGTPFIKYLMEKAEQGVSVQIILSKPSLNVDEELKEYFRQIKPYPLSTRNCIRNHAKVVIVDEKVAYIGSANATRAGLGQYTPGNFEAGILTDESDIIISLMAYFSKIWDGDFCEGCHRASNCVEY